VTPTFRILADAIEATDHAADITARVRQRLLSLAISDEAGLKADTLELVLDDRDDAIETPRKGVELRCWMGFKETGLFDMGLFVVDELEFNGPPAQLQISAKAVALEDSETVSGMTASLREERSRSWHETTLGSIVRTIAAEAGYSSKVDAELAAIAVPHVDQTAESDLNFLSRLAVDVDAVFKPAASSLLMLPRAATARDMPRVAIHGPRSQAADKALKWSFTLPEREAFGRVVATYQDLDEAELVEVVAGDEGPIRYLEEPRPSYAAAALAAAAELQRIRRKKATGRITVVGNPLLVAESIAQLEGFRPEFDGEWLIERAVHKLGRRGYQTVIDFKAQPEVTS